MKHFMDFDGSGFLQGRYIEGINDNIPESAVEVSKEFYFESLQRTTGTWKINRETGDITPVDRPDTGPIPPQVPQQVTRAQGKAVLIQAGLWQDVLDYVDGISDPTERQLAEVALNDTTHWQRTSPFLNAAAAALDLTSEQLDDLFQQAAEIEL